MREDVASANVTIFVEAWAIKIRWFDRPRGWVGFDLVERSRSQAAQSDVAPKTGYSVAVGRLHPATQT